jgi:uncharacterized membrane protein
MSTHRRALIKTITWRVIAIFSSVIVLRTFTGRWLESIEAAVAANLVGMALYYLHERAWGDG